MRDRGRRDFRSSYCSALCAEEEGADLAMKKKRQRTSGSYKPNSARAQPEIPFCPVRSRLKRTFGSFLVTGVDSELPLLLRAARIDISGAPMKSPFSPWSKISTKISTTSRECSVVINDGAASYSAAASYISPAVTRGEFLRRPFPPSSRHTYARR